MNSEREQQISISQKEYSITEHTRVAVVHDWIFERRGGEKVLERILNLFPQAHLYYLFGQPEKVLKLKHAPLFFPSFLNKVPFIAKIYKHLLPLLPVAIESFDLTSYELIISTSSCVAKGIIPSPLAKHVSYIHSPMRYAWDQEHRYFKKSPSFLRPFELLRRILLNRMRIWDVTSSIRIDKLIANSEFVARRCQLYYGKNAEVIYPPVEINLFEKIFLNLKKESRQKANSKEAETKPLAQKVLLFGAWVPYKKMYDTLRLLVENNIQVIAAGHGEEIQKAFQKFEGKVDFFLSPTDAQIPSIFAKAKVLLFPAVEDFGIVPLEATASGLWVVAPNTGGTKETVLNKVTGFTFQEGNNRAMLNAVKQALQTEIFEEDLDNMASHVARFSPETFDLNLLSAISSCYSINF